MDILERLKAAMGPDRELDAMVAVALQVMPSNAFQPCASTDAGTFGIGAHEFWRAPAYTASIDVALALVERMLPESMYDLHKCETGYSFSILRNNLDRPYFGGATPAIAILIALFTALQGEDKP